MCIRDRLDADRQANGLPLDLDLRRVGRERDRLRVRDPHEPGSARARRFAGRATTAAAAVRGSVPRGWHPTILELSLIHI